jgi:hypothetical protein
MKKLLIASLLSIGISPAQAISRYNSTSMSCASAHQKIAEQGAVILRYRSPRGLPLYDRFVINDRMCEPNEAATITTVPTADTPNCPVFSCKDVTYDGDAWDN